ncbi:MULTISPECIES: tyrosine-type recombinase/integrase [Vibrio harveyi group]|uniref:tyrosine-type recombinase/integrase n=1 Tax=Vibrio harveyi group TaxID=717610 RepID=UPI00111E9AF3|nr:MULTISPECIES: tyrosine-type recombinase/integrase [Vibrio harveyi group]MCR9965444.1 tyrosine-type recombinase/integrase [Vibrio antiquarius]TOK63685.1 integrase [Vibrio parahaemolyticus]TOK79133.1 integrase [Vibrio parahaemolyticus]TOK85899.1 integrase [Vibrio parahaemolyticus]
MISVNSTSEFKIKGYAYPDFPLLLWSHTNEEIGTLSGTLFEEGHQFLEFLLIKSGRIQSRETWKTYAAHLVSFFTFIEDNGLDWTDIADDGITEMIVAVYRDACLDDGMKNSSVNQHLRTIVRFYQFALKRGWVSELPYSLTTITTSKNENDLLAHTKRDAGKVQSPDIMLNTPKKLPKFLSKEEVQELLIAIKNPVVKLMTRLCLQTGIRKKELLLFPLNLIRKPVEGRAIYRVEINRTKGEKERVIHIPHRLMKDLWNYTQTTRHEQVMSHGTDKKGNAVFQSDLLFLNTNDNKKWALGSGFNKALNDLGLDFKVNPHKLRHTYACHTLKGLQERKQGKFEPLMYLQRRLGHSSITTTMIYLEIVNDLMDDLALEYQDQINEISVQELCA